MSDRGQKPKFVDVTEPDLEPVESGTHVVPPPNRPRGTLETTAEVLEPVPENTLSGPAVAEPTVAGPSPGEPTVAGPAATLDQTGDIVVPSPSNTMDLDDDDEETAVPPKPPPRPRPPKAAPKPAPPVPSEPLLPIADAPALPPPRWAHAAKQPRKLDVEASAPPPRPRRALKGDAFEPTLPKDAVVEAPQDTGTSLSLRLGPVRLQGPAVVAAGVVAGALLLAGLVWLWLAAFG